MEDSTQAQVVELVVAGVQAELRALVEDLVRQQHEDLRVLESALRQQGQALLSGLLGRVLAASPAAVSRATRLCPACQQPLVDLGPRPKTLHLLLGDVVVARVCGYCPRCGWTHAALDTHLGVDQSGRSPQLVEALALLGTELPFGPAAERLGRLCGVTVSASQLQQVTEGVGRTLAAEQEALVAQAWATGVLPAVEQTSPWLVVALDGVMVAHADGYHEVRSAALAGATPSSTADGDLAWQPWRYVVHPGDVLTFGRLVSLEAWRQGMATAERVLVLGDGAAWIWNLAAEHFPGAVQILDLWHATEHLWAAGRALYGEGDARVPGWVAAAKTRLLAGEVQGLLAMWADLPPRDAAAWAAEQTYFRNQAPRMAYDQYRAAGYPLGSGAVESANRHVVGVRVKQAGMRWGARGVRGVLALRALLRSDRWSGWWDRRLLPVPLAT